MLEVSLEDKFLSGVFSEDFHRGRDISTSGDFWRRMERRSSGCRRNTNWSTLEKEFLLFDAYLHLLWWK